MSLGGGPLPWSAEQQEWLAALGYTVYATGEPVLDAAPEVAEEVAAPPLATAAPSATPAPRRAPSMGEDAAPERAAPPARAATPRPRTGGRLPDRLHFALIRASGCNPNAAGAAEIFAQWPSSAELRGNAAAKRALWPRLRALRKQGAK